MVYKDAPMRNETFTYEKERCECEKKCLHVERDVYMWKEMCERLRNCVNVKRFV